MINVDNLNTTYQDIITTFVLNTILHHVGMLWIIETHEQLKYNMDKYNSEWITGGPWYNTSICKKLHGNFLRDLLKIQELTDIISCALLMHMEKSINHIDVMESSVGVVH